MYNRRRRARRLAVLLLCFCAVCAAGLEVYRIGLRRSRAMTDDLRRAAVISYGKGDYPGAVVQFAEYFDKSHAQETDPTALFAYANARANVAAPRMQHVYDAIQLFQRYLASADDSEQRRAEARRTLLHLYVQAWYSNEAIELADRLIQSNPNDADAWKAKIQALDEKKDERGALASCQTLNRIAPRNFWGQRVTVYLMKQAGATDKDLISYAQDLQRSHPGDPLFEMVLACAYELIKDADQQRKWLHLAAEHTPTDPEVVGELADRLDRNEMFGDAGAVIRRAWKGNRCPALDRMLVRRLWEDGQTSAVIERTSALDPRSPAADAQLLVYRALALQEAGRMDEAQSLAGVLAARGGDRVAAEWASVLRARFAAPALSPSAMLGVMKDAVARDQQNPALRQMLAEAWVGVGETEPALGELKQVVMLSPGWAAPHLLGAKIFGETGRFNYALDSTIAARARCPERRDTQVAHARALYHYAVASGRTDLYRPALDEIRQVRNRWGDPSNISAYVDLLSGTGDRDEAIREAQAAIRQAAALPADVLLELASVSRADKLGLEPRILDAARMAHGLTPEIALAQARADHEAGRDQKGLQLLLDGSSASDQNKPWRVAIARYRELTGDLNALRDWELLGRQHPDDIAVQRAILFSRSRERDREFWQQTIDRLRGLTGEAGIEWRAERARFLLSGQWTDNDRDETIKLLREVVDASTALPEPHRLLAIALEKSHDIPQATTEWLAAYHLRPGNPLYATGLVELLNAAGQHEEAVRYLDEFCRTTTLGSSTRKWAAGQYARAGREARAAALLKEGQPAPKTVPLLVGSNSRTP